MQRKGWVLIITSPIMGLIICLVYALALRIPTQAIAAPELIHQTSTASDNKILAGNDLAMHCYSIDFADLAVLPPFSYLCAQVMAGDHFAAEGIPAKGFTLGSIMTPLKFYLPLLKR